jgi:glycosyltransferase involved in cell wall biosynthesis
VGAAASAAGCVRVIADTGGGVYAAYTRGLKAATGDYVWLMGDDDFPLDAAARLSPLIEKGDSDLIIAPVIYSTGRLYRPVSSPFFLMFRNWCQQGVIYRRSALLRHRMFRRLKTQADHYINILLYSDTSLKKHFFSEPVCVFGAHGISSRHRDLRFRALRPLLARRTLGMPGFLLFQLIANGRSFVRRLTGL